MFYIVIDIFVILFECSCQFCILTFFWGDETVNLTDLLPQISVSSDCLLQCIHVVNTVNLMHEICFMFMGPRQLLLCMIKYTLYICYMHNSYIQVYSEGSANVEPKSIKKS